MLENIKNIIKLFGSTLLISEGELTDVLLVSISPFIFLLFIYSL